MHFYQKKLRVNFYSRYRNWLLKEKRILLFSVFLDFIFVNIKNFNYEKIKDICIYIFKSFTDLYCLFPTWNILSSGIVFRLIDSDMICFQTRLH